MTPPETGEPTERDYRAGMTIARTAAKRSRDPSTKVGSVLLHPDGRPALHTVACNGFPYGVEETWTRWQRPQKYRYVEHAERNSIFLAAKYGLATAGLTLVGTWAPCADCARAIVQAGIIRLVRAEADPHPVWDEQIAWADAMLVEAGIEIITLPES